MGTSKSYGGPGGPPLLPAWATNGDAAPPLNPLPDGENLPAELPPNLPSPQPIPLPRLSPWSSARRAMGSFAKSGDRHDLANAARSYSRAKGGAKSAASTATTGQRTTAVLGQFFSGVASRGIVEVARELGLENIVGKPLDFVITAITNCLAPDGATLEDVAVRRTVNETLAVVFEKYGVEQDGITKLDALDAEGVRIAVEITAATFIYQRWLQELEIKIEERAISPQEAVRRERDIKMYVKEAVSFDLRGTDPLKIDWEGKEGRDLIERVYQEAYSTLEQ